MASPTDEYEFFIRQKIKELDTIYAGVAADIKKSLLKADLTDFKRFRQAELLTQIKAARAALLMASKDFTDAAIPPSYGRGTDIAAKFMQKMGVDFSINMGNKLHTSAIQVMADQMMMDLVGGVNAQAQFSESYIRRTQQLLLTERELNTQIVTGLVEGSTRREVSDSILDAMRERLTEGQMMEIKGKKYQPDYYARLVARTRTREAVTQGSINAGVEAGIDLFQVSVHERCCDQCLPFQGRVFSYSGNDPDFPKLESKPPYHPHCRHVLVPMLKKHLERLGQLEAAKKLRDPSIEITGDNDFRKFIGENSQTKVPAPSPPTPTLIDGIPHGQSGAKAFGVKLTAVEGAKPLGGSTGATMYQDVEGAKWVVKNYGGGVNGAQRAKNEYLANRIYQLNNVSVPEARLAEVDGVMSVASKFIEESNLTTLGAADLAKMKEFATFKKGFVTDAYLANWDVAGLEYDNVLVVPGSKTKIWRVDQGGSLLFRAQGTPKGKAFGKEVLETTSLRNSTLNPSAATAFSQVTDEDIIKQIATFKANVRKADIEKAIIEAGFDTETTAILRETMLARYDDLSHQLKALKDVKSQKAVRAASAQKVPNKSKPGEQRHHRHIKTYTTFNELEKDKKWHKGLDEEQKKAIASYTGTAYRDINEAAWKGGKGHAALDAALDGDALPGYDGFTQRTITGLPESKLKNDLEKFRSGEWAEVSWSAYSSSSVDPHAVFKDTTQGFRYVILNRGKQGGYVGKISSYKHEKELLYGRNSRFRVVGIGEPTNKSSGWTIFLEEVDGEIPNTQSPPPLIDVSKFNFVWSTRFSAGARTDDINLASFMKK